MKWIRYYILSMSFVFIWIVQSFSQAFPDIVSQRSLAEKIYLQLDGKVYTTNNTIWFKSLVVNAADHSPAILSGVLYVELIDPVERIIEKKVIKLKQGIGDGFFDLNPGYLEGVYQVRAYTEWNKNFGTDFIFKEYIHLFSASNKPKADPIGKITLVKEENSKARILASLNPYVLDSLHKRELNVIVGVEGKRDTFSIKKNGEDKYLLDYLLPEKSQFVSLQIETKNQFTYTKMIALSDNRFDLQFFPESGEMVHGLQSKVGFKALDYNGKGRFVEGTIVNREGQILTTFRSNKLGMGSFFLNLVDSTEKYFAKLSSQSEEKPSLLFPLPMAVHNGNVLSVAKRGEVIRIQASSSYLTEDTVGLRIACRGLVCFDIKGKMKEGDLVFAFPSNRLPEGVLAFTLMDKAGHPLAERLCFNERLDSRLRINLSASKDSFNQREMTSLNVETTSSTGEPARVNLSILVINRKQMGSIQSDRQNILSYLLLGSDLKGEIENPGYYFSKECNRTVELDALLLTQGWRRYLYASPAEKIHFQPEASLKVSGSVTGIISAKKRRTAELTMLTFGKNQSAQKQRTDSMGRFSFDINDEFGQNLNVLIQSTNTTGKKKDYTITVEKKLPPVIDFNHILSIGKVDSVVHQLVNRNIERKTTDDSFKLSAGDILLGEVVVEAYRMTPERKKVIEEYGEPDRIISGKEIQDKEEKWSYGLYSVLMFKFPDKVLVRRAHDGNLYAKVRNSEMTLVVIDGIPVLYYDYPFIPNIPPSEVSSFELIEGAKNFSTLFMQAFPGANPMDIPAWGDVIAIYTHGKSGIYGAHRSVGIIQTSVPVFSAPREFYAPKYENIQPTDWYKPDLRALVHWEPNLQTDSAGKTTSSFYNADNLGDMEVIVEAISDQGELGYQELSYHVRKSEHNKEQR